MIRPVSHRPVLRRAAVAAAAAAALVCTACSGSENAGTPLASSAAPAAAASSAAPAAFDASKVGEAVQDSVRNASSVHISGNQTDSDGSKTKIDLQLGKTNVTGTVEKDGLKIPLLRVGEKFYFQFSPELAKNAGVPDAAAAMVVGKWVPLDSKAGKGLSETLRVFLNYDAFAGSIVSELGKVSYTGGQPADVSGTPALQFRNGEDSLYLEAAAPHRLLRAASKKDGNLDFADWDKPVVTKAPDASEIFTGAGS